MLSILLNAIRMLIYHLKSHYFCKSTSNKSIHRSFSIWKDKNMKHNILPLALYVTNDICQRLLFAGLRVFHTAYLFTNQIKFKIQYLIASNSIKNIDSLCQLIQNFLINNDLHPNNINEINWLFDLISKINESILSYHISSYEQHKRH